MKPIIISGEVFSSEKIAGTARYSFECLKGIDDILNKSKNTLDVRLCCPYDSKIYIKDLKSIKIVPLKYKKHFRMYHLRKYIYDNEGVSCNFANDIQLYRRGIVCVHDLRALDVKDYDTLYLRKMLLKLKWSIKLMNSMVVTVSEFQKERIRKICSIPKSRIRVIPNGWEHIKKFDADDSIFDKFKNIRKNEYYYSLGSMAKHKNFKWIFEIAKRNPNVEFVVAGNVNKEFWGYDNNELVLPNIVFCGYVSDEENIALMKNCKAFLFPSKYEGFGIPPLEALALGKRIIISNSTCLPEIFKRSAVYFDPDDYGVDLQTLYDTEVEGADGILEEYSWKKSAQLWVNLFEELAEK